MRACRRKRKRTACNEHSTHAALPHSRTVRSVVRAAASVISNARSLIYVLRDGQQKCPTILVFRGESGVLAGRMSENSTSPRSGVLMVWCDRPRSGRRRGGRLDELNFLAWDYHYVCPSDYAQLEIREFSEAKDPRVLLKRCAKCRTTWYGPTLSELKSRPAGASGLLRMT